MGTGVISKADSSPLVSLCRERKELIKAARDCRYYLATAHTMYFRSLLDVGNALNQFVGEDVNLPLRESEEDPHSKISSMDSESELGSLTDYVHGDSKVSEGPELSVPKSSENDSYFKFSSMNSKSELGSLTDYVQGNSEVSEGPKLSILKSSEEESHFKFPSMDSESEFSSLSDYDHGDSEVKAGPKISTLKLHGQVKQNSNVQLMTSSSLMSSSVFEQPGAVPMTMQGHDLLNFFHSDFQFGREKTFLDNDDSIYGLNNNSGVNVHVPVNLPYNYFHYPQDGNRVFIYPQPGNSADSRASTDFPQNHHSFPSDENAMFYGLLMDMHDDNCQTQSALAYPPPMPEVSAWDFLNPFNITDDIYFCYYSQDTYTKELGGSNHESIVVREKEGIPDLEDEFEKKLSEEVSKEKIWEENPKEGLGPGIPREAALKTDEDSQLSKEKGSNSEVGNVEKKGSSDTHVSKGVEEEHVMMERVSNEVEHGLTQDYSFLGSSSLTALYTSITRNLLDAVKEIRDAFEAAFTYGKEVSILLEAGRPPYQPMGSKIKAFALRILGLVDPSAVTSFRCPLYMPSNHSVSRKMTVARIIDGNLEYDMCRKYGDLSSTLEKLYMWEKKLYKEVKGEEKLRIIYEKECKKLKSLEDKGADFSKIENTCASIKRLLSKINIAVTAVYVISKKIHKLRDEELQPQLNELIEGLMNMWKCVLKCHQKQYQAIVGITTVHIVKSVVRKDSNLKATLKLEHEILNWGTRFTDYIRTQKAFVKLLNEWLLRCLFQEPEDTPDGIAPLSPSRIGAPPVFVVCNDWYHANEKMLETGLSRAIHDFASSLHQLWEKLHEEHCQRLNAEYLSKVFQKRLRYILVDSEMHLNQNALPNNATDPKYDVESAVLLLGKADMDLVSSLRKDLDEQQARHEEAVKQANDAALGCIQGSMVPLFEALKLFCSENLKAYELVRITNPG